MQCEEIHVAEENSGMEWSDIVFETCKDVAGEFQMSELRWNGPL